MYSLTHPSIIFVLRTGASSGVLDQMLRNKIKNIVEKVNKIDPKITYFITTNATLINNNVAMWFVKNENIQLYVSLAGIPIKHNELRISLDGKYTYNLIKNNLLNIRKLSDFAYTNRVNFVFNIFDEIQLEEINKFWFSDELFNGINGLPEITHIDCVEDDGSIKRMANDFINKYSDDNDPLYLYIQFLKQKDYNNLIVKYYDNIFLPIYTRKLNDNQFILASVCKPFINKLFVDASGQINICENFKFGGKFGNICNTFNIEYIDVLLSEYLNQRKNKCRNCWAVKICSLCFKDLFENNGNINNERVNYLCNIEQETKKDILSKYCTVLEEDETLLDHLNNYKIYQ
jgi:uncharacterized protein